MLGVIVGGIIACYFGFSIRRSYVITSGWLVFTFLGLVCIVLMKDPVRIEIEEGANTLTAYYLFREQKVFPLKGLKADFIDLSGINGEVLRIESKDKKLNLSYNTSGWGFKTLVTLQERLSSLAKG